MSTEYKATAVAIEAEANQSRDTWALADAVMHDAPEDGRKVGTRVLSVNEILEHIAAEMETNDVFNPNGNRYTIGALYEMRKTAKEWPEQQRSMHASYRTHQEAGLPDSRGGVALALLTRVADGEKVRAPNELDPQAFKAAVEMVKANPRARHKVTANALRTALSRRPNTPPVLPTSSIELHKMLADARHGLGHFAKAYQAGAVEHMEPIEIDGLVSALQSLGEFVTTMVAMLRGITEIDEAFMDSFVEGVRDE